MLRAEGLSIGYRVRRGRATVAENLDLELHAGELVCLLGPNGAGKSTLMRTISGMQPPLAGRVLIDGADLGRLPARERAKIVSVVLTERITAGLLTGYALAGLGRHPHTNWLGRHTDADHRIIENALRLAGAERFSDRVVAELSDGERQRVMLARALAQQPRLMILDEITAFLDLPRRVEVMALLRRLARESRCAVLISTHDLELALRNADRVWLLGAGGAFHAGAPEDLVLNGAFADAFADDGIEFDAQRGAFDVRRPDGAPVRLLGDGSAAQREWTERALARGGFRVCAASEEAAEAAPCVELLGDAGWRLQSAEGAVEFATLHGLMRRLGTRRAEADEA